MLWDLVNFQKIKRALLYALYMSLVLLVQDALFSNISIFGVRAMFVPAAAVAVGMFEGGVWGAVFSLALGFLADISFGNTALFVALFPCIGFAAGALSRYLDVLVGDGRDLRGVVQQSGDEGATGGG